MKLTKPISIVLFYCLMVVLVKEWKSKRKSMSRGGKTWVNNIYLIRSSPQTLDETLPKKYLVDYKQRVTETNIIKASDSKCRHLFNPDINPQKTVDELHPQIVWGSFLKTETLAYPSHNNEFLGCQMGRVNESSGAYSARYTSQKNIPDFK